MAHNSLRGAADDETDQSAASMNSHSMSNAPAGTIIDIAATFGVDTVILGGRRRTRLVNLLKGNVVVQVAANLPKSMHLIVIG